MEKLLEGFIIEAEVFSHGLIHRWQTWFRLRVMCRLRKPVPRTSIETVVAAKNSVTDRLAELQRDSGFILDRKIGDTASCIEDVRRGDGLCRT